jgi:hypothetical protein
VCPLTHLEAADCRKGECLSVDGVQFGEGPEICHFPIRHQAKIISLLCGNIQD